MLAQVFFQHQALSIRCSQTHSKTIILFAQCHRPRPANIICSWSVIITDSDGVHSDANRVGKTDNFHRSLVGELWLFASITNTFIALSITTIDIDFSTSKQEWSSRYIGRGMDSTSMPLWYWNANGYKRRIFWHIQKERWGFRQMYGIGRECSGHIFRTFCSR